ncbi:MAG TPA: hypothetical protein VL175_04880 [Pirellulales bacterium]|jgi:hypothetical protein|nr:hypothetical protein [Pirellulales bacterium]
MAKLFAFAAALVMLTTQVSYARYGDNCCCEGQAGPANVAATRTATAPGAAVPTYRTAQPDFVPAYGRMSYQAAGARAYSYDLYGAPYYGAGFRDEVNTHNYPDWPSRYSFGLRPASSKANWNYAH